MCHPVIVFEDFQEPRNLGVVIHMQDGTQPRSVHAGTACDTTHNTVNATAIDMKQIFQIDRYLGRQRGKFLQCRLAGMGLQPS